MKKFNRRERAGIYYKAAQMESISIFAGSNFLYAEADLFRWKLEDLFKTFPEISLVTGDTTNESEEKCSELRILALLFAREIARNP